MRSSPIPFIVSLLALFLFFNACRRMLVACAPTLLQNGVFSQTTYGFLSSLTSILFGVVRFGAYYLVERFPLDRYVCLTSVIACSVCAAMCLFSTDSSSFYVTWFPLLSISIALPFPCSSAVVQHSIDPSCIRIHPFIPRPESPRFPSRSDVQSGLSCLHPTHVLYQVPFARVWSPGSIRSRLCDGILRLLSRGVEEEGDVEARFVVSSNEGAPSSFSLFSRPVPRRVIDSLFSRSISRVASSANGPPFICPNSSLFLPRLPLLFSLTLPPHSRLRAFRRCFSLVGLFLRFHFRIRFHETASRPFHSLHRVLPALFRRFHFPPSFGDATASGNGSHYRKCVYRLLFVRAIRVDGDGDHAGVRAFRCESDAESGESEHAVGGNGGGIPGESVPGGMWV